MTPRPLRRGGGAGLAREDDTGDEGQGVCGERRRQEPLVRQGGARLVVDLVVVDLDLVVVVDLVVRYELQEKVHGWKEARGR